MNCGNTKWNQSFVYDPYGNITKNVTGTGTSFQSTYSETTSATNQLTLIGSQVPSYDNNGNLTNDTFHSYTWDAEGKMLSVDGSSVSLTYDALGRMIEQARGSTYTQILYGPTGGKLALMNGSTLLKAFVPLPAGATAVYAPGTTGPIYYRHSDWLGSSRLATTQSRTMYSDGAYAPFGENYAASGTSDLNFTGQNQDTVQNYYDFIYREYSQVQGRWISPDPAGRAAADLKNPQSWNRYAYVSNQPTYRLDPVGLHPSNSCGRLRYAPARYCKDGSTGGEGGADGSYDAIINGYDIFDAIQGVPGTYLTINIYGQVGFGFSSELWAATHDAIDNEVAFLKSNDPNDLAGFDSTVSMSLHFQVVNENLGVINTTSGLIPDLIQFQQTQSWILSQLPQSLAVELLTDPAENWADDWQNAILNNPSLASWIPYWNMLQEQEANWNDQLMNLFSVQ